MHIALCKIVLLATLFIPLLTPAFARSEGNILSEKANANSVDGINPLRVSERGKPNNKWDVTVGGGVGAIATYEGSDSYKLTALPFFKITYDDMISLSPRGLNAYWHHDGFKIGGGLTYNGGRKDEDAGLLGAGDDELRGMGDIDGSLGIKGLASYEWGPVEFKGSLTKFTGDNNDGLLGEFEVSTEYRVTDHIKLSPHISATWADESYMQTFFGVTSTQAANSKFSRFTAESSLKDVGVGLGANYTLNDHWFVRAEATVKMLTGDAADSPISASDTQEAFLTMVGYRF